MRDEDTGGGAPAGDGTHAPPAPSRARGRRRDGRRPGATEGRVGVTERERSEAGLRAVLETALDAIITMDHAGRVVAFNPAAERMFGYTRAEALGRELAVLIIPAALREQHRAGLAAYLATGAGPLVGRRVEIEAVRRDGSPFPVELAITRVPLDGPPLFTGYIRDITARVRAEEDRAGALLREQAARADAEAARVEALARAAERDAVFEAMADGVFVFDRAGAILRMNSACRQLLGLAHAHQDRGGARDTSAAPPAAPGQCIDPEGRGDQAAARDIPAGLGRRIAPRDADGRPLDREHWPVARILRGEVLAGAQTDVMARTLDGREVLLGVSGAPLYDQVGQIVGGVCICRDVTERRRLERRALEANRRMDEFLGIAGHEMRTPLTSIMGNIQVAQRRLRRLREREDVPAPVIHALGDAQHLLDRGETGLRRLGILVNDLLDVSRIQAGWLRVRPHLCDLAGIVREAVDEQRQIAAARAIHLDLPGDAAVPVSADAGRIGQVVTNYLSNALKYSAADRPVTAGLDVDADGGLARFWVRDEGPGVAPADQEHIWERFYRAERVEPQHGSGVGLGLGLYISRTIIAQHGGEVGVDSVPGAGATFWFTIPLARPALGGGA